MACQQPNLMLVVETASGFPDDHILRVKLNGLTPSVLVAVVLQQCCEFPCMLALYAVMLTAWRLKSAAFCTARPATKPGWPLAAAAA